jgi:hypothetical protein
VLPGAVRDGITCRAIAAGDGAACADASALGGAKAVSSCHQRVIFAGVLARMIAKKECTDANGAKASALADGMAPASAFTALCNATVKRDPAACAPFSTAPEQLAFCYALAGSADHCDTLAGDAAKSCHERVVFLLAAAGGDASRVGDNDRIFVTAATDPKVDCAALASAPLANALKGLTGSP